jgi:hypothetical protein
MGVNPLKTGIFAPLESLAAGAMDWEGAGAVGSDDAGIEAAGAVEIGEQADNTRLKEINIITRKDKIFLFNPSSPPSRDTENATRIRVGLAQKSGFRELWD